MNSINTSPIKAICMDQTIHSVFIPYDVYHSFVSSLKLPKGYDECIHIKNHSENYLFVTGRQHADMTEKELTEIRGKLKDYFDIPDREELARSAMARLTREEKIVLGLPQTWEEL